MLEKGIPYIDHSSSSTSHGDNALGHSTTEKSTELVLINIKRFCINLFDKSEDNIGLAVGRSIDNETEAQ